MTNGNKLGIHVQVMPWRCCKQLRSRAEEAAATLGFAAPARTVHGKPCSFSKQAGKSGAAN